MDQEHSSPYRLLSLNPVFDMMMRVDAMSEASDRSGVIRLADMWKAGMAGSLSPVAKEGEGLTIVDNPTAMEEEAVEA